MQLEALQLLRNQRQQGFEAGSSHEAVEEKLAPMGYRPLRVRLGDDGCVHSVTAFSADDGAGYWSLVSGTSAKKKRFPALRLDPLTRLDENSPEWELLERVGRRSFKDSDFKEVLSVLLAQLRAAKANELAFRPAWEGKAEPLLRLGDFAADPLLARVIRLVRAFGLFTGLAVDRSDVPGGPGGPGSPEKALIAATADWVSSVSDALELETAVHLVVGKRIKTQGRVVRLDSVQLCFDVYEPTEPMPTVYTGRTRSAIAAALPKSDRVGTCALTGQSKPLLADKFPVWTGRVRIYSKNSDAPCNQRYGRAGLAGFPISEDAARAITNALAQMIDVSREGKTWSYLFNGKGQRTDRGWKEDRDWLLAYPSFPVDDLRTIDIFQPPADDLRLLRRFEDLAETLCSRLVRQAPSMPNVPTYLQVLLIRNVSKGQVQLVFSDQTPVPRLAAAVSAWRVENLPRGLRIPMPSRSGDGLAWSRPRVLFPAQIARLLSHQWVRAGTESTRVEGPPIGLILEVFLRKPGVWEQNAAELLAVTLARATPLLKGLGHLLHRNPHDTENRWRDLFPRTGEGQPDWKKPQPGRSFVDSISLIGSLLNAMNSTVDEYTNESAYLLGRLLAMMDELHRCYCVAVRDGALPSALIGHGLLGRAAEAPVRAIEELLDRSRIYLGWAKTAEPKGKEQERIAVFSARKVLRLAGPLSEQLHRSGTLTDELTAAQKAHLFLGYLSPVLGGTDEEPVDSDECAPAKETSIEGAKEK